MKSTQFIINQYLQTQKTNKNIYIYIYIHIYYSIIYLII